MQVVLQIAPAMMVAKKDGDEEYDDEDDYEFDDDGLYSLKCPSCDNEITVDEMSKTFDYYMEKYLHIKPHNLKEGTFQDSHWTSGFGYFPTYALGSAMSAHFIKKMSKDIDVDKELEQGCFKKINEWLTEIIH